MLAILSALRQLLNVKVFLQTPVAWYILYLLSPILNFLCSGGEKMWLLSSMFKHSIHQVVNMEWGNFWSSHLPRTPYDISLDDETQNRNDQVTLCKIPYIIFVPLVNKYAWTNFSLIQGFEKMISGIYLGEIARLVLHRMALESDVFGDAADNLATPFTLR